MENIIKKKFKDNAIVLNAPTVLGKEFVALNFKTAFDKKDKSSNTLVLVIVSFMLTKKQYVKY